MKKNYLKLATITCMSLLTIGLFSCNNEKPNNDNTNINNNDDDNDNQDDSSDNKETPSVSKTYTITTDKLTNFLSTEKESNGVYIKNDGVKDTLDDIEIEYASSIIGISSNKDYLNFFQFKKNSEDNIKINTELNVYSIIVFSSKNTTYDQEFGLLNIKVGTKTLTSKNEILSSNDEITNFKTTYKIDENMSAFKGTISFSGDASRAAYVSSIEIYTK